MFNRLRYKGSIDNFNRKNLIQKIEVNDAPGVEVIEEEELMQADIKL